MERQTREYKRYVQNTYGSTILAFVVLAAGFAWAPPLDMRRHEPNHDLEYVRECLHTWIHEALRVVVCEDIYKETTR